MSAGFRETANGRAPSHLSPEVAGKAGTDGFPWWAGRQPGVVTDAGRAVVVEISLAAPLVPRHRGASQRVDIKPYFTKGRRTELPASIEEKGGLFHHTIQQEEERRTIWLRLRRARC